MVEFDINSITGTGEESCLSVDFSDDSNSLTCVAGVVSNLVGSPSVLLMGGDSTTSSTGFSLTSDISKDDGEITCTVCINVKEADIHNHCSNGTISISSNGGYIYTCVTLEVTVCTYLHILSTVPGLITPVRTTDSVSGITIDWSRSDSVSADIVRYIVDVREYSSAGPGKVQMRSITGYPLELPSTTLQHTVKSLSKTLSYWACLLTCLIMQLTLRV